MLLAAGRGERLRPLTDTSPKALVEVNGESLLERHLRQLSAAGVSNVVINTGWLGEQIVERIGSGRQYGLQVAYSPEYERLLETGGGVYRALPLLGPEPFWVVNADIVCDRPFAAPALPDGIDAFLMLVPNPDYRSTGDFNLEAGRVRNGTELPYTFSGIACYRPRFFADCAPGRFGLAPMLQKAADEGRLSGEVYEGLWADIGTPERLAALNKRLQQAGSDDA
ncbi:MAG: nucleotidyltransferase family protein [Woeseia sp.]